MSRMLTLIHAGWAAARATATSGRRADALAQVARLLTLPDLPAGVAADAHRLAAELEIETESYKAARRHLRAATALEPAHARTHYLAGVALERDPAGDDRRAARRFRRASTLVPGSALYRAAFGRAAVRCGMVKTGLTELRTAADAGLTYTAILRIVIDGLVEAGRVANARRVLVQARFARPHDPTVKAMWERVRFEAARTGQRTARRTQEARPATEGAFRSLPFVRLVGGSPRPAATGERVRRDVISLPRPHLARLGFTKADC